VLQDDALRLNDLGATLIHADVSDSEFWNNWAQIPLYLRCALLVLAPVIGAYMYLTASRRSLAQRKSTNDDSWTLGDLSEKNPSLRRALLTSREERLVEAVNSLATTPRGPKIVGIVFGAGHMWVVTDLLMRKLRFAVVASEWLTVIDC
jgi:hypothetical protein